MTTQDILLSAKEVRIVRSQKVLLRDVSIDVRAGDVMGVLGPSGAGKSTLFRAITGEIELDGGSIELLGENVTKLPMWQRAKKKLGYVPQGPSVLFDLTVRDNLRTFQTIARGEEGDVLAEAERVQLADKLDTRAGDLSAGERRRLELARAIVTEPRVLICDEPFAGVDPIGAGKLGELLRSLAEEKNVAVVLADHHVEEALRICTRAVLLLDGKLEASGEPSAFREHPLVAGRYLGTLSLGNGLAPEPKAD